MTSPRLFATPGELAVIRSRMQEHDWYARCFENLRAPADELLRRGISIPREKGYVFYETCPTDNTPLLQDPFNLRDHPCPTCGTNYVAENYRRAGISFYHLYLSQRTLEMGIAYGITGDPAYASAIREILVDYARHYEGYPLADYVLGPTRVFQSTFIESLWLASLVGAADFVRETIPAGDWSLIKDELFLASAGVIRGFDEGDNNRQAMNNVAIGLVGISCGVAHLVDLAVEGPHGWMHHLSDSVLEDGMWYEGDNYHFATLAAMLNLAEAMSRNGRDLLGAEVGGRKLEMMFDAPLRDLYPDFTMPARKDSRYGSPIGQRWHVGMYEMGYRRYADPAYGRLLRTLYQHPPSKNDCIPNVAGVIDVLSSVPANRENLDWRGFLNAVPELPESVGPPSRRSVDMPGTGLAILRADNGDTYASVDYGRYGGEHGHPDRLHLNFFARGRRWLTDWGTGNYLFDHLRWYRSTVAHNTVVVDGQDQDKSDGTLRSFDEGTVVADAENAYHGVRLTRTVILLAPDLLLDLLSVVSEHERRIDWALHPYADLDVRLSGDIGALTPHPIDGQHYEWLEDTRQATATGDWIATFVQAGDVMAVHTLADAGTEVFLASALGPPQEIPKRFPVLVTRRHSANTTFAVLIEHRAGGEPIVDAFQADDGGEYLITLLDGTRFERTLD